MKKIINIEVVPEKLSDAAFIKKEAAKASGIKESEISEINYLKRSLDSRHRLPRFQLSLEVYAGESIPEIESIKAKYKAADNSKKAIIIGAGPAGYFAALELLEHGIKPMIFERGKDVSARKKDIKVLLQNGEVNPNSNYCFGEGGAGAYSDGKLYTRSDKRGNTKKALQIFVEHGASQDIMIDAHPHIGSDKLPTIISEMRKTIIEHGGEVFFESLVSDIIIKDERAVGVVVNNKDEYFADAIILATGHSARDIYYLFDQKKIYIEQKAFAVGFRIEHQQELINSIQYGANYNKILPAASYKLVAQAEGRGVFSFCMCPGGIIVPASTAPNELVVNGMSNSGRNSKFANSGIVTSVDEKDFQKYNEFGALAGLKFQEELEKRFYQGESDNLMKAPAQRLIDFVAGRASTSLNESSYVPGLKSIEINKMFPKAITKSLQLAVKEFGVKMRGYYTNEANVIGLESRTSSPVRISRNKENFAHVQIPNLFPCGEGAGYAGGIISSAMDGQNAAKRCAELILEKSI